MRRLLLVLILAACRKPEVPAPVEGPKAAPEYPDQTWSSVSEAPGAVAEIRQTATERNHCRSRGTLGAALKWESDVCLSTRAQLRFVSADAEMLVVLTPQPDADDLVVARVFRQGRQISELTPSSLKFPPAAMRIDAGKLRWLGERAPAMTGRGVEVQLLDGSTALVPLQPVPVPPPAAPTAPRLACSPCSYTDAAGDYHLVANPDEIPPEYRKSAGSIRGSVQRADAVAPPVSPSAPPLAVAYGQEVTREVQPPPAADAGVQRNELGEDFIQYTRRISGAPAPAEPPMCIANDGTKVKCGDNR